MDPNEKELDYSSIFDDEMTDGAAEMSAPEETGEAPEENTGEGAETAETQTETPETPEGAEEPETQRQAEHAEAGRPEAKRQQTPEENARYAAARRDAERQRDEAIAAERRSVSELFAQMGIINPYTGKPIASMEEWNSYRQQHEQQQKRDFMAAHNMDEAQYNQMVSSLPEVREARIAAERAKLAERSAADARAKTMMEEQLREISKLDPEIKSAADLMKSESYPEIYQMVKKGYNLYDAYRLANYGKLTQKASATARQQVLNNQAGKEHLIQTAQRGTGIDMVPPDVRQQYRMLNPGMSDAEIIKSYTKYQNETRKNK